ncbi:lysophospholipid acyltransferase family protein [Hyphococcus sp.]|uniref:lysophospholipid acyltransferase family protein n=1 Tax=Hyphococcus sp. TaxID=2038636 RepID=UPI003CCC26F4
MLTHIRSLAFTVFLILYLVIIGILFLPTALFGRRVARAVVKKWSQVCLFALKVIAGVSYRLEGAEHIPQGGAIVAANHQSMWETIALHALLPKPVIALKRELMRVPVYGWWAHLAGHIPIDRKGGAKALRAFARNAKTRLAAGEQVIIFPEGTRLPPGEIRRLLPGAAGVYAISNVPCVPVAHDSGRFWRYPGIEKRPGVITIRFLPPIEPGLDRKIFQHELRTRIENARPDLEAHELK